LHIPKWGRGTSAAITGYGYSPRGEQRGGGGSVPLTPLSYYMIILYMNIIEFIRVAIIMSLPIPIGSTFLNAITLYKIVNHEPCISSIIRVHHQQRIGSIFYLRGNYNIKRTALEKVEVVGSNPTKIRKKKMKLVVLCVCRVRCKRIRFRTNRT
jgi:hypothetical protein